MKTIIEIINMTEGVEVASPFGMSTMEFLENDANVCICKKAVCLMRMTRQADKML